MVPAPVNLTDQPLFVSNINWSAILFRWQKCYQATGYVIQIASSVTFSSGSIVAEITTGDVNSFNWTGGESSKQYFWRVRGNHKTNFDEHDHVREILTQPAKPILEAPLAGAANISAPKYTFNWSDIPGPNAVYRFQISTDPKLKQTDVGLKDLYQFPLLGSTDKLTESKWTLYSLKPNTKYYWRVRGANNKGISAYSYGEFTTGSFTTANDEKLTEIYVDNKYVATVPSKNDQELELPTGNITPGYHTVSVRFKEGTNNWSSFTSKKFLHLGTKANSISSTPNQVEYWFNNDFAGRKSAPLAGTGNQEIQFDTKDLDQGQHTVFWRTRAKGDLWSSVVSSTFRKSAKSDGISQMEYWFNNGFDRRKQKTVSNFAQVEEDLDITDLPLGNHRLFYRFQHAGGKWSAINTADYNKRTGFETGPLQMQYWFDSAVGVPNSLVVSTANEGDFGLSAHHLDSGWHKVFIRFRKSGGLWSSLISNRFYKQDSAIATCDFVAASDSEAVAATKLFCQMGILRAGNTECVSTSDYYFKRKDVASLTMRALVGHPDAFPFAKPLPSLFGDLQEESTTNSCYFSAAKLLSYLDFGDGIAPFNGSRLNFNPNDTIVRGYALKVLMEAWDIKPDASLHNPFSDLVPGAEVNGYILKAAQLGLVKRPDLHGSAFSSFRPFRAVSREEFFIMLYRVLMTASRPEVRFSDLYLPFNRTNIAGRNPGISEGNFSSYREEPFILRGVPGLNFNFNYNSSLLELPESAAKGRNWQGKLLYDKEPLGKGWTHNYNAYIVVDIGNDDINSVDDRWMMVWPGGNIHVYQPQQAKYLTHGVYDKVSYSGGVGAIPEQIVVTMKNQVKYVFHKLAGSPTGELLHLIRIEDRHGNAVSLDYENGFSENDGINIKRLMKVSDPQGRNFTFSYADQSNRIIGIASKAGNIERSISFTYNGSRLIKYANPKGYETTYNYGLTPATEHLIYSIVLPRGNTITNTYSTNRKIQSTAYTNGSKTIVDARPEYTVNGIRTKSETTTIVDGRTIKRSVVLNDIGALVSSKGPLQDDSIAYGDSRHRTLPTYIEDRIKEVITRIEYDANGNQTRTRVESSGTALETRTTFNDKNDVLSQTDARGNSTTYQYNGTGQLTEMRAPIGTTVFTPNTNGTVSQVTNPAGIATQYSYDLYGNQIMARLPLQIESRQEWDSASRMIAKWDARGAKTERQYDVHDNLELETFDPNGLNEKTTYRYDKNDNLLEIENAKGNITYLSYNNEDQMVKQQFGEYSKQFDYHNDGRLKSLTTPNNARFNYRYNNNGQLQGDGYAAYGYYPDGMLQTITKNGQSLTYRYDAFGRVAQTSYSDFPGNSVSYEYDANGNTSRIRYPGGFAVRYNYDANNVLKQVTDDGGAAWVTYQYLDDGRLSMATNKNGTISKYFYDDAGRMDSLVNLKGNGEVIASYGFEMDKVGNHTEERFLQPLMQMIPQFSRTDTFTYNSINRFLTRNEEKFEYDPNGNLTNHTIPGSDGKYYVWDTKDNLLRFEEDGQLISYDYDGLEQRRRRNEVRYVLDNNYNVLMETDLDGNPLYYYVQGLGLVSRIKANTQETGYYHYDYRGSTVAITNTAQEITHQYNYDAFGVLQQAVEDDFNAYRYVGKYGVAYESKDLTFMRARYYQPSVGRFLSEDPIWAVNLYPYGDNNPISRIDPNGKFWK
ncbi:MAG: RHS repeat protein, partial [Bacteroidetes bacterium]